MVRPDGTSWVWHRIRAGYKLSIYSFFSFIAEARRRDPEGYEQLMRLMKQMFEKLDEDDARKLGRDMTGQHVVEFGQCVMLLEQLY